MSDNIERAFCPRCAIKHIAQARALMLETRKGYPEHVWYAMGHLAEAEDEIIVRMPEEGRSIRAIRMLIETSLKTGEAYVPDFGELMRVVAKGAMLEEVQETNETKLSKT